MKRSEAVVGPEVRARYEALREEARRTGEAIVAFVEEAVPVGAYIEMPRGNGWIRGTVIRSGGSWWHEPERIVVRLASSGKEFHCSAYALLTERDAVIDTRATGAP